MSHYIGYVGLKRNWGRRGRNTENSFVDLGFLEEVLWRLHTLRNKTTLDYVIEQLILRNNYVIY